MGDVDRYGRTVAEVWRGSINVNLKLVATGQAFVYRQYLKSPCAGSAYLNAEQEAESAGSGVWSLSGGITRPWDFRRARRGGTANSRQISQAGGGTGRYTCRSIGNWARAQELLRQGHTYLDRNGDGEACERLK